ncbi:hypothetical protein Tco_0210365 [Tanacetum coccineum]
MGDFGNEYLRKGQKQSQHDKTEHENEKSMKSQFNQSKSKSKSTMSKSKVKDKANIEEILNGPTCTHLMSRGNALTWWNSYVKTVSHEVAYGMTWKTLKKIMTHKYYPRGEIKKLEIELMFPEEYDDVEKYVGGLPDMIQGTKNKRKLDDNSRKNQNQQHPFKRQNVTRAYTAAGPGEKKVYRGSNLWALNATTITMGSMLPSATTARKSAIWPVTVEAKLLLPTTREP